LKLDDLVHVLRISKPLRTIYKGENGNLNVRLQERQLELSDNATVTCCVQDLPSVLSDSSLAERKSFIKSFVKEVADWRQNTAHLYDTATTVRINRRGGASSV